MIATEQLTWPDVAGMAVFLFAVVAVWYIWLRYR